MPGTSRIFRTARDLACSALLLPVLLGGCEESSSTSAPTNGGGGAKSTLGKAKESADRTIDKMRQRQDELSKQADDIFNGDN